MCGILMYKGDIRNCLPRTECLKYYICNRIICVNVIVLWMCQNGWRTCAGKVCDDIQRTNYTNMACTCFFLSWYWLFALCIIVCSMTVLEKMIAHRSIAPGYVENTWVLVMTHWECKSTVSSCILVTSQFASYSSSNTMAIVNTIWITVWIHKWINLSIWRRAAGF